MRSSILGRPERPPRALRARSVTILLQLRFLRIICRAQRRKVIILKTIGKIARSKSLWIPLVSSLALAVACKNEKDSETDAGDDGGGAPPDGSGGKAPSGGGSSGGAPAEGGDNGGGAPATDGEHVYIVGSALSGPEGWDAYIAVLPELVKGEVDYDQAFHVSGRADVWVWDGKVFIAEAETPRVTRYRVDEDLELVKDSEPLDFTNTGLTSAQFWNAIWLSSEKAYMNNATGDEYIIWNPRTMEIEGSVPRPDIEAREGFTVATSSTNRGSTIRDGRAYHSYYWTDENWEKYEPDSRIAVYDVETDELIKVIEAPCPGLDVVTQDEEGNIYYSGWTGLPGLSLVLGQPTSCVVKIPAGSDEIDEDFTFSWPEITEGRHGAALRYQSDGFGLFAAFHDERIEYDDNSDAFELIGTENWLTWRFNFETKAAEPLEDIAPNSGAIYVQPIGKVAYALVPTTDYLSSIIYEVDGKKAKPLFETRGWSTRLFQLR